MLAAESRLAQGATGNDVFASAIAAYRALLEEDPDNPRADELLYQLSRAQELNGDTSDSLATIERLAAAWPASPHAVEAHFRSAESYFAAGDYPAAEAAYARVIAAGAATPYYANALYMQGWAGFKQARYDDAIFSFTATLDQLLPLGTDIDSLSRPDQELARDCLRMEAVIFSYQEGAQSIASSYAQLGERPYQHLLYQALGELYLSQERYRDSAQTLKAYASQYPDSPLAHEFQLQVIAAYEAGGFPELIVAEKAQYVTSFGIEGAYWQAGDEAVQAELQSHLREFTVELAEHHHATAQTLAAAGSETADTRQHYQNAAQYYQLYIDSFPQDPAVPDMAFQLAQSRLEAGEYQLAIDSYEWVAYNFSQFERAADAGYGAVVTYEKLPPGGAQAGRRQIDSELKFANTFAADPRAAAVLAHAADSLLASGEYEEAIATAGQLVGRQPPAEESLLVSAWLVQGHSEFELQHYMNAERAYALALAALASDDERRSGVEDRYAASLYKQGETVAGTGEPRQVAEQFARVIALAPASAIRASAQFDASDYYTLAGDLAAANELLVDFRQRFPEHELTAAIPSRLLANYEQQEQWGPAAAELDLIHAQESAATPRRQALFRAAQYYDRAGNRQRAMQRYRSYVEAWPQPMVVQLESMNRLAELSREGGDQAEQQRWLLALVATHEQAGADADARSLYLAANAASLLADQSFARFSALKLRHPLKSSLPAKQAAMQEALAAYKRCNDYGVEEFATLATYRMAMIYQQLGDDLLASERPANLDELALEQYELLLSGQAFPFEEKAISIHEANTRRSWQGVYDPWVRSSFVALAELVPARYDKPEIGPAMQPQQAEQAAQLETTLRAALAAEPDSIAAYNHYGIFLRQQGRFIEAEATYQTALAIDEADPATHRNIGVLYDLYMGESEVALQHYYRYRDLSNGAEPRVALWIADLEQQQVSLVQGARR
jgi:TolA-binding protein